MQAEVELLVCDGDERGVCVDDAMRQLSTAGLDSVLVEGGASAFTSFLLGGCWDVMHVLIAPFMVGGDGVPLVTEAVAVDALPVTTRRLGRDVLITYLRDDTKQALDAHFSKYVYRHR